MICRIDVPVPVSVGWFVGRLLSWRYLVMISNNGLAYSSGILLILAY